MRERKHEVFDNSTSTKRASAGLHSRARERLGCICISDPLRFGIARALFLSHTRMGGCEIPLEASAECIARWALCIRSAVLFTAGFCFRLRFVPGLGHFLGRMCRSGFLCFLVVSDWFGLSRFPFAGALRRVWLLLVFVGLISGTLLFSSCDHNGPADVVRFWTQSKCKEM